MPVNPEIEDAVNNFLFELGSCGTHQTEGAVVAYFSEPKLRGSIQHAIKMYFEELEALGHRIPSTPIAIDCLEDEDWNSAWKSHFKPLVISDRLVVKPTWETFSEPANTVIIEVDPKQAFGTGHHATTRMALQFLEKYLEKDQLVLDVGTGTGILAIAAAKLGARKIIAFDNDWLAVETASENVAQNSTSMQVSLYTGEVNALRTPPLFDIVLANVNTQVTLALGDVLLQLTRPGGLMFFTGIPEDDKLKIKQTKKEYPDLKLGEIITEGEWIGIVFQKRGRE